MSSSNIWRIQINLLVFTKFTFPVLWRRLFLLWRLVVICACVKTITSFVRHPSSNRNFSGLSEKKISEMLRLPSTRGYPNISKRQIHTDVTATSKRTSDMERKTVSIVGSGNWWEKRKDIHLSVSRFLLKWHCVSSILQFLTVCIPGNKNIVKISWGSFSWNALKRVELNN